jgi:hypothetical protein
MQETLDRNNTETDAESGIQRTERRAAGGHTYLLVLYAFTGV